MDDTTDFSELDKTNFKCFKFPNGDLYYGEIAYYHPEKGLIENINDIVDEEVKSALKIVRHGNGAQLYGVSDQKTECKYEGSWYLDKKKGRGTAHFIDGSIYEGDFDNDLFDGRGKLTWRIGNVYIGKWKQGKMEGEGEFKHQDGHILRGLFKNNYMYDKEKNIYLNPFLTIDDSDAFKNETSQYANLVQFNKVKFTEKNIKLVYGIEEIISQMETCIQNNMTPLLIRTVERIIDKNQIFNYLPNKYVEIDLKYYYVKLREYSLNSPQINEIYEEIKGKFEDAITNGKYLILNYDDCQIAYDELFDPSLKEISGDLMFSPLMFNPLYFSDPKNYNEYIKRELKKPRKKTKNSDYVPRNLKLNPNFRFIVYSRFLITDVDMDISNLRKVIENKFKSFPLKSMNVFVLSKPKKQVVEPTVQEEETKIEHVANTTKGTK